MADNKTLQNIKSILLDIDAKISHVEDLEADNRAIIVKLVKQSNEVVKFLQKLEVDLVEETVESPYYTTESETLSDDKYKKFATMKEMVAEYLDRFDDLKEFEEELKKHKDDLTPGQVGES